MAEARKVGAGFIQKQVVIDGNTWNYREIGAGESQRMTQAFARVKLYARRAERIDKKLETGTDISDEDMDKQEEYLDKIQKYSTEANDILFSCLSDGTPDNKSVREWFDKTPQHIIEKISQDILKADDDTRQEAKEDSQSS